MGGGYTRHKMAMLPTFIVGGTMANSFVSFQKKA
jgi:hypothetical protein